MMSPLQGIDNTGAGPILITEDFLEPDWLRDNRAANKPLLRSGTNQTVDIDGTVLFHLRMGEARIRAVWELERNPAVPILLGTYFNDSFSRKLSTGAQDCALQLCTGTNNRHSNQNVGRINTRKTRWGYCRNHYSSWWCRQRPTTYTCGEANNNTAQVGERKTSHNGSKKINSG